MKFLFIAVALLLAWLVFSSYMIITGAKIFVIIGVCIIAGIWYGKTRNQF